MNEKNIEVLVVDDEPDFRKLMTFWLESKGYSVTVASSGKNALQQIEGKIPDIIFMDLRMPVMDGAETIGRIRKFNKDIPIIVITAFANDPKLKEATDHGISGVFNKSKDLEESLSLLEVALRTHRKLKK